MPRRPSAIPKLCHHKPSGRAVAYVGRKAIYFGPWGSPEARTAYGEFLADLAQRAEADAGTPRPIGLKVSDVLLKYATDELPRYSLDEQRSLRGAIRIVRELFGETPVAEFGPLRLRVVREAMVEKGWSRGYVNRQVKRLQGLFRWAVGWELVAASVAEALRAVQPLRSGETTARDSVPRRAVPAENLQAVRAELQDRHRDVFDLLLLTGARPGELFGLTIGDIDRSGDVWRADLQQHKTRHKGKDRVLFFNRDAQAIILRHLKADPASRLLPMGDDAFREALKRACVNAGVPVFTGHWLRHTVATRLADTVGTEAAQRLLGHAGKAMTEHYSRAAERVAIDAAKQLGTGG